MKRKTLLFLMLMALFAPLAMNGQNRATVSWGSTSDYSGTTNGATNSPFGRYFGWEYKVFCYRPNTLPFSGNITQIGFLPATSQSEPGTNTNSSITINGTADSNPMQIWMKDVDGNTSLNESTTFSTYVQGATKVYSGNIPATTDRTMASFTLSTSFSHSQEKCLLILVRTVANGQSGDGSVDAYYKTLTGDVDLCWYNRDDNNDPGIEATGTCIPKDLPVLSVTYTTPTTYTITAKVWPSGGGTVSGAGSYSSGNRTITATAANGYQFVNWTNTSGDVVSSNASYTFNLNGNVTYQANFTKTTVTALPWSENFDSYSTSTWTYLNGEWATPTRQNKAPCVSYYGTAAHSGYRCMEMRTSNGTCMAVLPQFDKPLNTLTVSFWIYRGNSSSGYTVQLGYVTNPSKASTFQSLETISTPSSQTNIQHTYTVPSSAPSNTNYRLAIKYTMTGSDSWYFDDFNVVSLVLSPLTFSANPSAGGTVSVTSNGSNISTGTNIAQGSTLNITATPANGYYFNGWTVSGTGSTVANANNASTTLTMGTAATTLTANFTLNQYTISVSANPNNGGTVSGGGTINHGASCTVIATPATNYVFDNWTENGTVVSSNASYTFTVNGDRTLVANFHLDAVNITATAYDDSNNTTGGGTISGTGSFNIGSTCELEATPDAGYEFVNWTENGTAVSTSATYSFTVSAARDLVAHFRLLEYTLTLTAEPAAGGTVSASPAQATYHYGDVVEVAATPNSGYTFGSWSDDGLQTHTITITDDTELTAYFGADQTLTTYANPIEGGYVTIAEDQVSTIGAVTVGDGTGHNNQSPFASNTQYSFVESLYLKSEMPGSCTITSLSFESTDGTAQSNEIEVYMMNVDKTSFTGRKDFVAMTTDDKVFDGTWTVSSAGWNTIILDTPFEYDSEKNLLIGIHEKSSGTAGNISFRMTENTIGSVLCWDNDDNDDMNPADLNDLKASNHTQEKLNYRANVRLGFGTYHYGQSVTLTAHANHGYQFVNWTENSTELGTNDTYTVTMDGNHTIYANFERLVKRFVTAGNWDVDNNWLPVGAPDITEYVVIEAAATIPSGVVATANEITINGGSITIEDGGQLQHNNSGVTVTTQKSITGYGSANAQTNKGYYLISSPVDGIAASNVTGLQTSQHYDLYKFVSDNVENGNLLEWVHVDGNLEAKTGYIYASEEPTALGITGTVAPSATGIQKTLTYNEGYRFGGWNLIGNPFVCNAYVNVANYYILNHQSGYDEFVATDNSHAIAPMSGLMVVATATGQSVTYSRTAPSKGSGILNIDVNRTMDRGTTMLDRARVRFGEGEGLQKFQFNPNHTKVYIPQDGSDYAVVYADGAGTIPVNFKAQDNGRYTLDFSTEDVGFNYLHLIDNMNGNDVDLLQTPYYAFDAKSTDFASRFTLVFATGSSTGSETGNFAFFNNGVWIINNDGDAELQVVDVLGHILSSETISGSCSKAINVAPGVYMLRLINGDKVKVQKIVVR